MNKATCAIRLGVIGVIALLSACTQRRAIAAELRYVKDKHQLCYAVLDSESDMSSVLSVTSVPRDKVGL
jgi:hypothetical protein